MAKTFNTTAVCIPEKHYMVNIEKRLYEIGKRKIASTFSKSSDVR